MDLKGFIIKPMNQETKQRQPTDMTQDQITQNNMKTLSEIEFNDWCKKFTHLVESANISTKPDEQILVLYFKYGYTPEYALEKFKEVDRRINAIKAAHNQR